MSGTVAMTAVATLPTDSMQNLRDFISVSSRNLYHDVPDAIAMTAKKYSDLFHTWYTCPQVDLAAGV